MPSSSNDVNLRYCESCGAEIPEGNSFCPNCGARVGAQLPPAAPAPSSLPPKPAAPSPPPPAPKKGGKIGSPRRKTTVIVAGIIVALLLAVAAFYAVTLLSPGSNSLSKIPPTITGLSTVPPTTSIHSTTSTSVATTPTQTSQATTATTTMSCPSTTSSGPINLTPIFARFRQMSVSFASSSGGQNINLTSSFIVIYRSSTTYKINVTSPMIGSFTAWVNQDGTVAAVYSNGQNMTGSQANNIFAPAMGPFAFGIAFREEMSIYTSSPYVHLASQGTATFGPTTMSVANYAPNSLPLTFTECGISVSLSEFSLQVGSLPAASLQMETFVHEKGTVQDSSGTQSVDVTFKLISVALA